MESKEILEKCGKIAVIDHHRKGVGFIENAVLVCHEPYSSSTSELVTELLQYVGTREDKPNRVEAEGLLSGIMLDTRDFTLHTGVRTFEAAAALRRYGAETERVRQLFDVTQSEYNAKAALVAAAQMYKKCAISMSGELPSEARVAIPQAANDLLTIQGVEASFVAVQVGSGVSISRPQPGRRECTAYYGEPGRRRSPDHGGSTDAPYHPGSCGLPPAVGHRYLPRFPAQGQRDPGYKGLSLLLGRKSFAAAGCMLAEGEPASVCRCRGAFPGKDCGPLY